MPAMPSALGLGGAVVLLIFGCGGPAPTTQATAEASPAVQFDCAIAERTADGEAVVSRPRVSTLSGRPVTITSTTGAGDGRPGSTLAVELTPTVTGDRLAVSGGGRLTLDAGPTIERPVTGDPAAGPVVVELPRDAALTHVVSCDVIRMAR